VCFVTSVAAPPRLIAGYRRHIRQQAGTSVRLQCPVVAEPTALVSWFKDDDEIDIAWDKHRVVDNLRHRQVSQLRIRNVTTDDSGLYVCTATNGFGTVRAIFRVLVYCTYIRLRKTWLIITQFYNMNRRTRHADIF